MAQRMRYVIAGFALESAKDLLYDFPQIWSKIFWKIITRYTKYISKHVGVSTWLA